ncbi:MAG: LpqB family beta-propeller domain-containing protein [Balneolaceae bacterium]
MTLPILIPADSGRTGTGLLLLAILIWLVPNSLSSQSTSQVNAVQEWEAPGGPHPLRFPHLSIRTEKYLLPAVTTGPLDPAWSPDGEWIVFSRRGDLWKVPSSGGAAVALTEGPDYYFEPAWSPDGQSIAFVVDRNGTYSLGVIDPDGAREEELLADEHMNLQPAWSPDGRDLYFVSDRQRGLSIFRLRLNSGEIEPVVVSGGEQIQPAPSPDGTRLAYISPVQGRPGSGGIWVLDIESGESEWIHFEETRHRAAPKWSADSGSIFYVSEITGNNDIAAIPASGGAPVWITHDQGGELAPAVSPDGSQIVFLSTREGPPRLYTLPAGGGAVKDWKEVEITEWRMKGNSGTLSFRVEGPDGEPLAARVTLTGSDGRAYAPEGGFHRVASVGEQHYFHMDGSASLTLPAGPFEAVVYRGLEYQPETISGVISSGSETVSTVRLERLVDAPSKGWYSGDTHAHDLHGGRFGLNHHDFLVQLVAEDLHLTHALVHQDGSRIMGRWDDVTGRPHPLSTETHILQYSEEFRGSRGHIGMLGIESLVMPFVGGERGTAYEEEVLNLHYIEEAHRQGGIAGFMHPYGSKIEQPSNGSYSEIPLNVALEKGDFYDVLNIPYDALENEEMYFRILNSGFRVAASGGSDNFADVWRDPPPGTSKTYAWLDGPLSVEAWNESVRSGHTFATSGPLLFAEVDGRIPGEQIDLNGSQTVRLPVVAEVASWSPLHSVDVIMNGQVVESLTPPEGVGRFTLETEVAMEGSGWVSIRAVGFWHQGITDSYAYALTTPVYVTRGGQRYTSAEDAQFLHDTVEALWQSVDVRENWNSEQARETYRNCVEQAKAIYQEIVAGGQPFSE